MSFENNIDDSNFEQHAILHDAAILFVLKGLSENDAISVAKTLHEDRQEAERAGQVTTYEYGNAEPYQNNSLNLEAVPESKRDLVNKIYRELCEKNGVDAL